MEGETDLKIKEVSKEGQEFKDEMRKEENVRRETERRV